MVLSLAREELCRINTFRAPADKLACIERCVQLLMKTLTSRESDEEDESTGSLVSAAEVEKAKRQTNGTPSATKQRRRPSDNILRGRKAAGADDFLPVFIWTIVGLGNKARNLHANIEYLSDYRSPDALRGLQGYVLTNLSSAVQWVHLVAQGGRDAPELNGMSKEQVRLAIKRYRDREDC